MVNLESFIAQYWHLFVVMLTRTEVTLTRQFYFRVYQWCFNLIYISINIYIYIYIYI